MQRDNEIVGYIYGDVGSTKFNFAVNGEDIKKFDYIYVPHKEGPMLAQVMEITHHSDLRFEDAAAILAGAEKPYFKTSLSAFAEVIGYRDSKNILQSPRTPFEPGTEIFKADEALIRRVLGLSDAKENGAYIGLLKGHDLPVYLNIDVLVQKHVCILAKTGGGKSYACGVLVEELLKKKVPMVIIDTHGEYSSIAEPNTSKKDEKHMERFNVKKRSYANQIIEYSPLGSKGSIKHLTLNGVNLSAGEIMELLSGKLSGPQKGVLYQAIKELKEYKTHYTLKDIIDAVKRSKSNARWNVIASLAALDAIGIFSEEGGTDPTELVRKGKCTIINMKGVPPDVQGVVVARLTKELFEYRKAGKIPPFLYIVEEAHNYCPERGYGNAVSSAILRTVASEGRKFGMGLCIVSQRPAKVDKNIISQCNTHIILKVTNPNDLKAITQSVEGLTSRTADEIQRLPIGVALIAGGTLQMPVMVEIRTRETKHGGRSVEISKEGENPDYIPPTPPQHHVETVKPVARKDTATEKAKRVARVAYRLGWVSTEDPDEAIRLLSEEAEKMNENVYKYLESLARIGATVCTKDNPNCIRCPMREKCKYRASIARGVKKKLFAKPRIL